VAPGVTDDKLGGKSETKSISRPAVLDLADLGLAHPGL
jgi:hypothetical protein